MLANKLNCDTSETRRSMFNRSLSRTQILKRELRNRLDEESAVAALEGEGDSTSTKVVALSLPQELMQKLRLLFVGKQS